jgi:two-component system, NtrC family, response regulator PilR
MSNKTALVIDDEADIRELVELTLKRMQIDVTTAGSLSEAHARIGEKQFDLCLTDMRLPDGSGIDFIAHLNKNFPDTPIAMITAYGNVEAAVQALKAGAFDFVSKPVDLGMLRGLVQKALALRDQKTQKVVEEEAVGKTSGMLGDSDAMQRVRSTISKLARNQAPVHISGESGTGKEVAARLIHTLSPRSTAAFVPVNCGAIPTELMESEFFGHKRGSFTGANADKDGLFQAANGGTLFLDEIAELPMHMQVKLLRVIQEKTVRPIGGRAEIPVDVRILSATHKDLAKQVEANHFRQDLYYRINVIELKMPALRERRDDIGLLTGKFLERLAPDWGISKPKLSPEALKQLMNYDFPGNVRELENILERAVALCENDIIEVHDLQLRPRVVNTNQSVPPGMTGQIPSVPNSPLPADQGGLTQYIDSIERDTLMKALEECRWNKTAAAKKLGITFRAMRYRLKKLGIE